MNRYVSAEVVKNILEDKGTELEAIVRCYDFPPTIRNVSPLYTMFTHNDTQQIVSYDLFKMYIAIIFYLKVQLEKDTEEGDLQRIEYDLGYAQYHLMKKFEQQEIDEAKYEEEVSKLQELFNKFNVKDKPKQITDNYNVITSLRAKCDNILIQLRDPDEIDKKELMKQYIDNINKINELYKTSKELNDDFKRN